MNLTIYKSIKFNKYKWYFDELILNIDRLRGGGRMVEPFLVGCDIYLRRLTKKDLEGNYFNWLNDHEVTRWMQHGLFPNSEEKMLSFYNAISNSTSDLIFAIALKDGDCHIGNIGIHKIHSFFRSAEIGILIGEKDCWGKGFGEQAVRLVVEHAFLRLNLHRLFAGAVVNNMGSVQMFKKVGFQKEGILRDAYFCEGSYYDCVQLSLLQSEWQIC